MARPTSQTPAPANPEEQQRRPTKAAPDRKRAPARRGNPPEPAQEGAGGPSRPIKQP